MKRYYGLRQGLRLIFYDRSKQSIPLARISKPTDIFLYLSEIIHVAPAITVPSHREETSESAICFERKITADPIIPTAHTLNESINLCIC